MAFLDFFRPNWQNSKPFVRSTAVRKLTDQALLARIAEADSDADVRLVAVGRLTDQTLLAQAARTSPDSGVRKAAVTGLTDQALLAQIARTDSDAEVRKSALTNLTDPDQELLTQVATTENNPEVRTVAVRGLQDQTLLAQVATTDSDAETRKTALWKLIDQAPLVQIARTDSDPEVRWAAVGRLTDQIAKTDMAAVEERITNGLRMLEDASLTRDQAGGELDPVASALDLVVAQGESGISRLMDRLYRHMRLTGKQLKVDYLGDLAWGEWIKKREIVKAFARARERRAVAGLAALKSAKSNDAKFHEFLQPAIELALAEILAKIDNDRIERTLAGILVKIRPDKSGSQGGLSNGA